MRDPVTGETVLELLEKLGKSCRGPGTVYITGGSSAVVLGWRETTIDVDLKAVEFWPGLQTIMSKTKLGIDGDTD